MDEKEYYPLVDTLRLYSGWLLAFLAVIYALGTYQILRSDQPSFTVLDEWTRSPLLLQVALLAFLFLLLSSIHRMLGRGLWKGLVLTLIGFVLFVSFRVNM